MLGLVRAERLTAAENEVASLRVKYEAARMVARAYRKLNGELMEQFREMRRPPPDPSPEGLPAWAGLAFGADLPDAVRRAIGEIAEPGTSDWSQLESFARARLGAGQSDQEVALRIEEGDPLDGEPMSAELL